MNKIIIYFIEKYNFFLSGIDINYLCTKDNYKGQCGQYHILIDKSFRNKFGNKMKTSMYSSIAIRITVSIRCQSIELPVGILQ